MKLLLTTGSQTGSHSPVFVVTMSAGVDDIKENTHMFYAVLRLGDVVAVVGKMIHAREGGAGGRYSSEPNFLSVPPCAIVAWSETLRCRVVVAHGSPSG
jgi:hypothetical protein